MNKLKGTAFTDFDLFFNGPAGSFIFRYSEVAPPTIIKPVTPLRMMFVCPCGCGDISGIPIKRPDYPVGWDWDGNLGEPTFRPSVQVLSGCKWHGYIRRGWFEW